VFRIRIRFRMLLSLSESASGGMVRIRGSASGSVNENVTDPQHWYSLSYIYSLRRCIRIRRYRIRGSGSRILRFINIFFAEVYPRPDGTVYVCGSGGKTAPLPDNPANVEVDEEVCQMLEQVAVSASYKPELLTVFQIRDVFIPDRIFSIPDPNFSHPNFFHPGSASKDLSILTQKISWLSEI
jgi:hypothetical protein